MIDSGATHSFIRESILNDLDVEVLQVTPLEVTLADGTKITSCTEVNLNLEFTDGHQKKVCPQWFKVVPTLTQELLLGMDWLK